MGIFDKIKSISGGYDDSDFVEDSQNFFDEEEDDDDVIIKSSNVVGKVGGQSQPKPTQKKTTSKAGSSMGNNQNNTNGGQPNSKVNANTRSNIFTSDWARNPKVTTAPSGIPHFGLHAKVTLTKADRVIIVAEKMKEYECFFMIDLNGLRDVNGEESKDYSNAEAFLDGAAYIADYKFSPTDIEGIYLLYKKNGAIVYRSIEELQGNTGFNINIPN